MQDAGPADFLEPVDLRDVSTGCCRDPLLRFCNHVVAVAEADRARGAHGRACRFQPDFQTVGAERAFVDLRREVLVIVFRNDEWAGLHARPATDAARFVEHHGTEIRFEHRRGRARRGAGWVFAVHAELAPKHPIGLGAGNDLVEGNERVIVGVKIARVLIAFASKELCVVCRPVVPRFACHNAGPADDTPGIVLNHRFRFHSRCAHARSFLLMLQRNTLVSGMWELASPTLAVRSLAMSPGTMPAYPQCHGRPISSITRPSIKNGWKRSVTSA